MKRVRCAVLVAGLGLLGGCSSHPGGDNVPPEFTALQEVDGLLRAGAGTAGRAPGKLADVGRYQATFPRGYEAVRSGAVVVLWGAPLKGEGEVGKDEAVVAYDKAVPAEGGYVLLSAGTVKKMSAAEFASAPKAGK